MKTQKWIIAEVEMPHVIHLLLPMELLYTGQFSMGSWTLHSYSFKTEQVYQVLYEYT